MILYTLRLFVGITLLLMTSFGIMVGGGESISWIFNRVPQWAMLPIGAMGVAAGVLAFMALFHYLFEQQL